MRHAVTYALVLAATTGTASAQYWIVDNLPGEFIDISGSGTVLLLEDDGAENIATSLLGDWRVANNGGISRSTSAELPYVNMMLPVFGEWFEAGTFLPFWDDLFGGSTALGGVWWQELPDRFIVQWTREHFDYRNDTITFQVQVFGPGGPGVAQYLYQDVVFVGDTGERDFGSSATVGVQFGVNSMYWGFNAPVLQNGTVLTVIPAPGTLLFLGLAGMLVRRRQRP